MTVPNKMDTAENTYVLINHGRIYKYPLKGLNPEGMTAWCDRRVFAEKGYKVTGCLSTYNIQCVRLDPKNPHDQMLIDMEKEMDSIRLTKMDDITIHWSSIE
jgi:hypothetical protein